MKRGASEIAAMLNVFNTLPHTKVRLARTALHDVVLSVIETLDDEMTIEEAVRTHLRDQAQFAEQTEQLWNAACGVDLRGARAALLAAADDARRANIEPMNASAGRLLNIAQHADECLRRYYGDEAQADRPPLTAFSPEPLDAPGLGGSLENAKRAQQRLAAALSLWQRQSSGVLDTALGCLDVAHRRLTALNATLVRLYSLVTQSIVFRRLLHGHVQALNEPSVYEDTVSTLADLNAVAESVRERQGAANERIKQVLIARDECLEVLDRIHELFARFASPLAPPDPLPAPDNSSSTDTEADSDADSYTDENAE